MLVYLDTCVIQRPFDDRTQPRIDLEAEAVLRIIDLIEDESIHLLSSEILLLEVEKNPYPTRRAFAVDLLALATRTIDVTLAIEARAQKYVDAGVRPSDALHLASAVEANADIFGTTDDKLYRRGKTLSTRDTQVLSPFEIITEIGL